MNTKERVPVKLLSAGEVSDLLGIPVGTLYQWRVRSTGPRAVRVGRHLRYDPVDLWRWIEKRKAAS